MEPMTLAASIGAVLLVGGLILLWIWRYTTVGPNEVLVISGRGQTIERPLKP